MLSDYVEEFLSYARDYSDYTDYNDYNDWLLDRTSILNSTLNID